MKHEHSREIQTCLLSYRSIQVNSSKYAFTRYLFYSAFLFSKYYAIHCAWLLLNGFSLSRVRFMCCVIVKIAVTLSFENGSLISRLNSTTIPALAVKKRCRDGRGARATIYNKN